MPCQQCENGKWKWGSTGECKYDSREACEAAHEGEDAIDPEEEDDEVTKPDPKRWPR